MLCASFFLGRKRAVFYFVQLQHCGGLQNLFDAGRIVYTGQLNQNFAFAFLAAPRNHRRLGQPEPVHACLNRIDSSLHRSAAQVNRFGRLDGQSVI